MRLAFLSFLFLININLRAQDAYFNWVRNMEFPASGTYGYFVDTDEAGYVYMAGMFQNSCDLDPGTGVQQAFCSTQGYGSIYISKFSPGGDLMWSRFFCSGPSSEVSALAVDSAGNSFITGHFTRTMDADPGLGTFILNAPENVGTENHDVFLIKLDTQGTFGWACSLGNQDSDWGHGIATDRQGNVVVTGYFSGATDFDPSSNVNILGTNARVSSFIWKLNNAGTLVWAHALTSNFRTYGSRVATDDAGNVYANGTYDGTIDLDPGPGSAIFSTPFYNQKSFLVKFTSAGKYVWGTDTIPEGNIKVDKLQQIVVYNGGLRKYDAAGNQLWSVQPAGRSYSVGYQSHHQLALDKAGNIFFTGIYEHPSLDFDPGPGYFTLPHDANDYSDVFMCRFSTNGDFVWAKGLGGFGVDAGLSLSLDTAGNIYTTGVTNFTVDFDPGPGIHEETVWPQSSYLLKLGACPQNTYNFLNITTCNDFSLNGIVYHESGTYVQTRLNAAGCDSIITLHLTVQKNYTQTTVTYCDSYNWNGRTLTTSGVYLDTLTTVIGCDSIVQLNLTINQTSTNTKTVSICEGGVFEDYNTSGIYTDVYTAANGCDSVRILHLTVIPKIRTTINRTICAGNTESGYSNPGIYIDTLASFAGCDSIRTLQLAILPVYRDTVIKSICEGENFLGHTAGGIYTDSLYSQTGCDSIVTINLTVHLRPRPVLGADTTLCQGTIFILRPTGGTTYKWQDGSIADSYTVNTQGIYTVTSSNECGSGTDVIRIEIQPCTPYLPNAFTPNNDGHNDRFGILQSWLVKDYHLTVYNRWGQSVFSSNDPHMKWDGTFRGEQLNTGTFIWHCTYSLRDKAYSQKGAVLLIR